MVRAVGAKSGKINAGVPPGIEAFRLYDMGDLAKILGVSDRYIQKLKEHGAPFAYGKSRPEWILDWLRQQAIEGKLKDKLS